MGERIPASIRFGGKITKAAAEELVKLVNDEGLDPDWGDRGAITVEDLTEELGSNEVNYGNLDELICFANNHNLAYVSWFDQGGDWSEGFEKNDGQGRCDGLTGKPHDVLFNASTIRRLGIEKILEIADWAAKPLPPLEIVDV